jgi:hypothetical protein
MKNEKQPQILRLFGSGGARPASLRMTDRLFGKFLVPDARAC